MATRSIISYFDGKLYNTIYCHWDGYPEHNGLILKKYYKDENKIKKLIELGDLSSLREELGEKHDVEDLSKGNWTKAYHRDRNSVYHPPKQFVEVKDVMEFGDMCGVEFIYIFSDDKWHCYHKSKKWVLEE